MWCLGLIRSENPQLENINHESNPIATSAADSLPSFHTVKVTKQFLNWMVQIIEIITIQLKITKFLHDDFAQKTFCIKDFWIFVMNLKRTTTWWNFIFIILTGAE